MGQSLLQDESVLHILQEKEYLSHGMNQLDVMVQILSLPLPCQKGFGSYLS